MNRDDPEQAALRQRLRENAGPTVASPCPEVPSHGNLIRLSSGNLWCPVATGKGHDGNGRVVG